ncbi:hypothetical protein PO909_032517 [Leuciscus waleckii]
MASRPPRSFAIESVLLLLLFAFRYGSALLAYDRQTLLDLRAWSETLLPSDRPLLNQLTPLLADIPVHLRRMPTVSPRRDRDQKSRSNGSYRSEYRRWLSCPPPMRKRSRRRGKRAGMIARLKAHLRASSLVESCPGLSPPARFVCSRWIRPVFLEPSPMLAPTNRPATLAQLKAGNSRRKFNYIQPPDAGPVWSAAFPVASRTRHQSAAIMVRNIAYMVRKTRSGSQPALPHPEVY